MDRRAGHQHAVRLHTRWPGYQQPTPSPTPRKHAHGHQGLSLASCTNATKRKLQAQGRKVAHVARRDLRTLAEAYLQDHREALLAEASVVVERWRLRRPNQCKSSPLA